MFGKETFFTIFGEQTQVYDLIADQLKVIKRAQQNNTDKNDQ